MVLIKKDLQSKCVTKSDPWQVNQRSEMYNSCNSFQRLSIIYFIIIRKYDWWKTHFSILATYCFIPILLPKRFLFIIKRDIRIQYTKCLCTDSYHQCDILHTLCLGFWEISDSWYHGDKLLHFNMRITMLSFYTWLMEIGLEMVPCHRISTGYSTMVHLDEFALLRLNGASKL